MLETTLQEAVQCCESLAVSVGDGIGKVASGVVGWYESVHLCTGYGAADSVAGGSGVM